MNLNASVFNPSPAEPFGMSQDPLLYPYYSGVVFH